MKSKATMMLTIVVSFIIGGIFTYSIIGQPYKAPSTNGNGVCYTQCTNKVQIDEKGISESVNKIYDAVVLIENYKNGQLSSTGTGFVYKVDDKYGYIMTNQHVVSGASEIKLYLSNGEEIDGTILGGDTYLDLAIVRMDKEKVLKVAEIGNSTNSSLGDTVFTVGNPLGKTYHNSVSRGTLSGLDRLVSVSTSGSSDDWIMKVLQTDAAVNPGNSGGPLVNSNGEVIGVISLKLVEDQIEGMGFAIPIEFAMSHVDTLEQGKAIERPMLGISMLNVGADAFQLYQNGIMLDQSITSGVVVVSIQENSGASRSDLKKGDVITKINGEVVTNAATLRYELYKNNIGDTIEVTYIRGKEELKTKITLTKNDQN